MSDNATLAATAAVPAATEATKLTDAVMNADETAAATLPAEAAAETVAPKAEETAEAERVASKFAALSRKEKALRTQERQLAARAKELEEKFKATEGQQIDSTKYIDVADFKKNPYKYMKDNGLTLEQLAEIVINDGKVTPEKLIAESETKIQKELREMREALKARDEKEQEERTAKLLSDYKSTLNKFVDDTPEYEMIRAEEQYELVFEVIDTHYNEQVAAYIEENGEQPTFEEKQAFIMDNKQACDLVEKHLLDKETARIKKLRNLNKTKSLFEAPAKPVEPTKVKETASATLTNTLSTQVPSSSRKTLTDEESKREASKLIKFVD